MVQSKLQAIKFDKSNSCENIFYGLPQKLSDSPFPAVVGVLAQRHQQRIKGAFFIDKQKPPEYGGFCL